MLEAVEAFYKVMQYGNLSLFASVQKLKSSQVQL